MWTQKFVDNVEADSLSRNLILKNFENEEDVLKVANLITRQKIIQDQEVNRKTIENTKNVTQKSEIFCKNIRGFQRIFISQNFGKHIVKTIDDFFGHIGKNHISNKI